MFSSIRRHQKWLWIVVSTFVIISFVVYFTPNAQMGGGGGGSSVALGSIDGKPITRDLYEQAMRESHLRFRVYNGDWADGARARQSGFDVESEAQNRLVLLNQVRELGIEADESGVADWIAASFQDRTSKGFSVENYRQFVDTVLRPRGFTENEFQTFVRHEISIQHLIFMSGVSGRLVTPKEAELAFKQQNEEVNTEAVFFSASNHIASVNITPNAIAEFFTNNMAAYRIPERVQVSYVQFQTTNYLAEADKQLAANTNLNSLLEMAYQQRGTNAFVDPQGNPLPADQAKERLKEDFRKELAMREARKAAAAFAEELFNATPATAEQLSKLASAKGLAARLSAPFDRNGPSEVSDPFVVARRAFNLTTEEPFSAPEVGQNTVYVMALANKLPSEIPQLQQVGSRVTEDYRNRQALDAARAAGQAFATTLTNLLAQGKTFAAASTGPNKSYLKLPAFSRSTRTLPEVERKASLAAVKDAAFALSPGKVSGFNATRDGGFILHVISRSPVDDARLKAELPQFTRTLQRSQQFEAFGDWFRKEREKLSLPASSQQRAAAAN